MQAEAVRTRHDGAVLVITIDRPANGNTIDGAVTRELAAAVRELEATPQLRAGLLTGAGSRHFCLGSDLRAAQEGGGAALFDAVGGFGGITRHPRAKPLVAALNGDAVGGGLELALACDFALAADSARLGFPEVRIGVIAGAGGLVRLPRQIAPGHAAELLLTGRLIDAARAQAIGLIARAVPQDHLLDEALRAVHEIAAASPAAVRATRELLQHHASTGEEAELWRRNDAALELVLAGPDAAEGRQAFLQRRPPVWAAPAADVAVTRPTTQRNPKG